MWIALRLAAHADAFFPLQMMACDYIGKMDSSVEIISHFLSVSLSVFFFTSFILSFSLSFFLICIVDRVFSLQAISFAKLSKMQMLHMRNKGGKDNSVIFAPAGLSFDHRKP